MDTTTLLNVVLLSPLMAAGLIWLFGRKNSSLAAALSILAAGLACVSSLSLLFTLETGTPVQVQVPWLVLGDWELNLGYYLTPLAGMMLLVVSFVGFLIHVFSLGYMKGDPGKGRFFGGLSIFMFSMFGIVLAENLFMLFIFWELVGFSSYMLIGHYLKKEEAREASKKAFIVNRVGDFGFLIGIILCYYTLGTVSLAGMAEAVGASPELVKTAMGLLLFCGVLGKSAQMPLHVWLPDAMAGPTPVSALIHAATMVAAGVYLLGRTVFLFTPEALEIILWCGTITALSAAIWAFAQSDIKKILAYSTLSQLGYMVAAFGLGSLYGLSHPESEYALLYGVGASMFHLTTHAFFKALLFLGSGSVIHACHHEQDIFKMGGLLKKMPITGYTFLIGVIAIAGVPGLAGFFSKDVILYVAKSESLPVFIILTFTALLTATYMGRLFVIAFLGAPKSEAAGHAKESPFVMTLPLLILAALSVVGGYAFAYPGYVQDLLSAVPHPHGSDKSLMIIISVIAAVLGLGTAWAFYGAGATEDALQKKAPPVFALSRSRFWFDEVYNAYVRKIQDRVSDVVSFLDTLFIGGLMMRGTAGVFGLLGIIARSLHTGNLNRYVWWFFVGVLLFWAYATGIFGSIS